ncbi:primosomal replication protein [Morganella morganii subsp. sibonii]
MNTRQLLQALRQKISVLETQIAPIADRELSQRRFDDTLFAARNKTLRLCMDELLYHTDQLEQCADENRAEQVRFLAEKIVTQIAALNREAATQSLRQKEQGYVKRDSQVDLYQRLAQHQDYERRLAQMTDDRELALGRAQTFAEQQKIQKELAALAGRLVRCRQALQRIERQIERHDGTEF